MTTAPVEHPLSLADPRARPYTRDKTVAVTL